MNHRSSAHPFLRSAILLALAVTAQSAAQADWLVTREGTPVETEGTWTVEGRQVIFTLPGGTLSAMRLLEVDLDASRAATEEANRPTAEPATAPAKAPKPEPVLVLTDKDIPKASTDSGNLDDGGAQAADGAGLRVIEWNLQPFAGGVILIGRLENGTQNIQDGIRVRVDVRNEEEEVLATAPAILAQENLVAGGITVFRARFAGFEELPGEPHFVIFGPGREPQATDAESAAGSEDAGG